MNNNDNENLQDFMFGSPKNPQGVSFVSKVNILCEDVAGIKKDFKNCLWSMWGSCFTFLTVMITSAVFLGGQFKTIEMNTANIHQYMLQQHELEKEVSALKILCENKNRK